MNEIIRFGQQIPFPSWPMNTSFPSFFSSLIQRIGEIAEEAIRKITQFFNSVNQFLSGKDLKNYTFVTFICLISIGAITFFLRPKNSNSSNIPKKEVEKTQNGN